jgi:hypothetical protein
LPFPLPVKTSTNPFLGEDAGGLFVIGLDIEPFGRDERNLL